MSKQCMCRYPGCNKIYDYNPEPFDDTLRNSRRFCEHHLPIIEFKKAQLFKSHSGQGRAYMRRYNKKNKDTISKQFGYRYRKVYIKEYRDKHKRKINKYMRIYMRARRARLRRAKRVLCGMK